MLSCRISLTGDKEVLDKIYKDLCIAYGFEPQGDEFIKIGQPGDNPLVIKEAITVELEYKENCVIIEYIANEVDIDIMRYIKRHYGIKADTTVSLLY